MTDGSWIRFRDDQDDVEPDVDERRRAADEPQPDRVRLVQRVEVGRVPVVPLHEDVRGVRDLIQSETLDGVADDAGDDEDAEDRDEEDVDRALTQGQ
jgi:hypothetical protein